MKHQEIEIKIKLPDAEALKKKVEALGGKKSLEGLEYDVMYERKDGNFFHEHKTLRLRKHPKGNLLTYKERMPDRNHSNLLERTEIQTWVTDYEATDQILQKLGYAPYRIKEKYCVHYELDGFEIEFHRLPMLGDFVEIEAEEEKLKMILDKLGLKMEQGINKDYSSLYFDYCKANGMSLDAPNTFEEEKKYHLQK